jgi:DNA-binding GntR family transcriptional regulator
MAAPRPLQRTTTVDALAAALRREILDGALPAGARLRERELTAGYGVARHSLRAALRALAAEGLVRIEPHRGARVAELDAQELRWLYELRTALELEAAHLALERNGGRLPAAVHAALDALVAACAAPSWGGVTEAHSALHAAIVEAAESPRIAAAHAALSGEMRLFLVQLRPHYSAARIATEHVELVAGLERDGPGVLRAHLREAAEAVGGPEAVDAAPADGRFGAAEPGKPGIRGVNRALSGRLAP